MLAKINAFETFEVSLAQVRKASCLAASDMNVQTKWAGEFPRKRREPSTSIFGLETSQRLRRRDPADVFGQESRPACAPAPPPMSATALGPAMSDKRASLDPDVIYSHLKVLVQRLQAGRKLEAWTSHANTRAFQFD